MGKVYLLLFTCLGLQNRFKIFRKLTFGHLPNELKHLDCSSSHSHTYTFLFFFLYMLTSKIMSTIFIKLKIRMVNFPTFSSKFIDYILVVFKNLHILKRCNFVGKFMFRYLLQSNIYLIAQVK